MTIKRLMFLKALKFETEEATITGNPVTFTPGVKENLIQCKVPFVASQSGSGDPSPSNIRPIIGWNELHVYHSGSDQTDYDTYTASWNDAAGIGYVDFATGELKITHKIITFVGAEDEAWNYEGSGNFYIKVADAVEDYTSNACSAAVYYTSLAEGYCKISASLNFNIKIGTLINATTVAELKAWLAEHNVQLLYKLATPVTVQLTAQQIETLKGENNIWSDSSENMTITYVKVK